MSTCGKPELGMNNSMGAKDIPTHLDVEAELKEPPVESDEELVKDAADETLAEADETLAEADEMLAELAGDSARGGLGEV
jgi:hypothetical protein